MEWTCECGSFAAEVDPSKHTRAVCYCKSCRDFVTRLGKAAVLDEGGGNDLFQVAPEQVTIKRGAEHLASTRLTEKGPLRWYVTCCDTPLANTLMSPAWPFLTLQTAWAADPGELDPVSIRVNKRDALARVPDAPHGVRRLMLEFFSRALKSRLSGGWRKNPLFDQNGKPLAAPADLGR